MSIVEYAGLILGSSVGVAFINWVASARSGRAQRDATAVLQTRKEQHEAKLQTQQEQHEAKLRRDEAHDEARDTFLPVAESLLLYFVKLAYDRHFDEVGIYVFPSTERTLLESRGAVLDATRSIMWGHPTQGVRDQARDIYDKLVDYWYDTDRAGDRHRNGDGDDLTQDEANGLEKAAEALIQLIHAEAPYDPVI